MPLSLSGDGAITGMDSANSTDLSSVYAQLAGPTFTGNLVWSGAALRAASAEVLSSQTTASSTFTDLATVGPTATVTTGTKALVIVTAIIGNDTSGQRAYMGFAVSGASTVAAADKWSIALTSTGSYVPEIQASGVFLVTGLTAGSNTFTAKYRRSGGTARFDLRQIAVIDMGS